MKEFVNQADHDGFTPLLRACQRYADWNVSEFIHVFNIENTRNCLTLKVLVATIDAQWEGM